jgi:hypothetical protein
MSVVEKCKQMEAKPIEREDAQLTSAGSLMNTVIRVDMKSGQ